MGIKWWTNTCLRQKKRRFDRDNLRIAKQMIELNKTAFDNSFKAMTVVYEQNEKMFETFLNQATWMPEAGRKAIKEWLEA